MKVKSLLIDDNRFVVTILSDLLKENHPDIEVVGVAVNGTEGIDKINVLQPDLVFLDVEMPDMNGFEMLNKLEEINFQTIFTTAHSEYAIKAFRFNALDYLLKPVVESELAQAIKRFKSNKELGSQNQVSDALYNLKAKNIEDQKLVLNTQQGRIRLMINRIVMIEGDRNYSKIHLSNNTNKLSSKTLGFYEKLLSEKGFFRCHRSFLVNRLHVSSIRNREDILLKNDIAIPISRRKKAEVVHWFKELNDD